MIVIPAIDIRGGRCVRLYRGDFSRETIYGEDPVQMALQWQEEGATMLHVVDLDGAREGHPVNTAIIRRICQSVAAPVQVGGGMRSLDAIEVALSNGATRVVLGTLALEEPALLAGALHRWREYIAVSLDARNGALTINGWQGTTLKEAIETAAELAATGVRRLIYTDISGGESEAVTEGKLA